MTAHLTKYSGGIGTIGQSAAPVLNAVGRSNEGYTMASTANFTYFSLNTDNTGADYMCWGYRLSGGQWRQSGFKINHDASPSAWQVGTGNIDTTTSVNGYRLSVAGGVNQLQIYRLTGTTSYRIMVRQGFNWQGGVS